MYTDEYWMNRALRSAEKGRGLTSPNPIVGSCLVKGNTLVSDGYHARFGGPHAEIEAIRKARSKTSGATLYVTLEPCSTYGKTPPCTDAIRDAGIRRVVIATTDPNPKHKGRGISALKKYGIKVKTGVLKKEADFLIEAFSKWIRTGLPFVTLKMAQSLDGKIATASGESRWISGSVARHWVHRLRHGADAVLVGKNTVLRDNPRLTARNGCVGKEPWRIVLDEKGMCSPRARIFRSWAPSILACSEKYFTRVVRKFGRTQVTVLPLGSRGGRLHLGQLIRELGSLGITSLLVEGGGEVAWSFLNAGLVDKIEWILAPKIIGGREAKTSVEGLGIAQLAEAPLIRSSRMVQLGSDFLIEGYFHS